MQTPLTIYIHSSQRNKILDLLINNDFVKTSYLLNEVKAYQYNARIKELRKEGYNIVSDRYNGVFGFKIIK
jgi:hypothetical protein